MKRSKCEAVAVKDARQGIVEQRPVSNKSHKGKKPYELHGTFFHWRDFQIAKFATLEDAEKSLAIHLKRQNYSNLRIVGPGVEE